MSRLPALFLAFSLAAPALTAPCLSAPPKIDYLYPAGASRGATATVTASGAFSTWPVKVHVHRPGVAVTAEKDKGKFKVVVVDGAAQGVYLLRAHDAEGASVERPFFVGRLPEANEKEPNNDPRKPQELPGSVTVNGRLEKSGDVDTFAVKLRKGQTLLAAVEANRTLGSPMDAVLQICDSRGFVLAQNDDGRGLDPLCTLTAAQDGDYLVRLFAFPTKPNSTIGFSGAATYVYRLTVDNEGFVDHTLPLAIQRGVESSLQLRGWNVPPSESTLVVNAKDDPQVQAAHPRLSNVLNLPVVDYPSLVAHAEQAAQPIQPSCCVSGVIESRMDSDRFRVKLKKGDKLNCRVEAFALGYPLDPLLRVLDASGKTISEVDDSGGRDGKLTFTAAAEGEFDIEVRDLHGHGGPRYAYRLRVETDRPDFQLTLAAGELTLPAGKPLEVQVNVARVGGFKDAIEVRAEGLPDGVTCQVVKAAAKDKSVKLKLVGDGKAHSGPLKFVGKSGELQRFASRKVAGLEVREAWLTALGKK